MILFDLIFLKIYNFLLKFKRGEGNSKWSTFLYVSAYFGCTVISLISLIGLFYENYVSNLFMKYPLEVWMSIFVLSPIILSFRYYRLTNTSKIEEKYNSINERLKKTLNLLIYSLMISIPVFTFILFRLFVIGHVRWW